MCAYIQRRARAIKKYEPMCLQEMINVWVKQEIDNLPGGLVRNSWSGEKGPGPSGVSVRTLTMYVVSGCSFVNNTLGSRTIWCHSSSCGWDLD